jgi:predicted nucleic acid-binding protein
VILVDTNVIVDVLKADPVWLPWSAQQLMIARQNGSVFVNYVIYAELHAHEGASPHVDQMLDELEIAVTELDRDSAKSAARAFAQYRKRSGMKTGVLPDFFIGAQALSRGWALLTRDAARYKTYFPKLELICP